ncbi:MAG: hypothetical protein GWN01_02840 [Nitrosopumilaceae archaeon]|nr:hypothetical protein [Nitrosopumilaceae archaeon]NIT99903.1 hypothetical protein [Nitrosopumilaceae archaeon]NIU86257.1 hypothetical protein [Nitrosopumilaceae archaeon]NIV65012.1 hypothetical protein [Nitrosopumilaceae archaeon]NIX60506.1 hypothetical protein [Nitrosopumilaceae archaeon]
MKTTILSILVVIFVFTIPNSYGHTTVNVEPYEIEVGWDIEPPVVGIRNNFVFEVSEPGETEGVKKGVVNAFNNLEVKAKFGGVTKTLDINSDPRPGHYFSPVIPTRTGTFTIEINGDIEGTEVDIEVPIEDVESTAVLDFPPTSGSSDQDVTALKSALSSLQQDISSLKSQVGETDISSENFSVKRAYNFGVFGLSLGAAGIILAVIALVKRK